MNNNIDLFKIPQIYFKSKRHTYLLLVMFSCGFLSYSQSFVLDGNGVTVKCTSCAAGDTGQIGGSGPTYTAHDNTSLAAKSKGASGWNLVVTSLVTDTSNLFKNETILRTSSSSYSSNSHF